MPTPLIPGNHLYGDRSTILGLDKGKSKAFAPSEGPRQGVRRNGAPEVNADDFVPPSSSSNKKYLPKGQSGDTAHNSTSPSTLDYRGQYEYPSDTIQSPKSPPSTKTDFNNVSHYARLPPTPLHDTSAMTNSEMFYKTILTESLEKIPQLDEEIWGKVFYMEREQLLSKLYLREDEVIVDGSNEEYDGLIIGVGMFENPERDNDAKTIRSKIGKGVKLKKLPDGSIQASTLSGSPVICKGYKEPEKHCISEECVSQLGRIGDKPVKIFDMMEFKSQIALELRKPTIDVPRLQRLSMVAIAFGRNTFGDMDTPCWMVIINFAALDAIGNEKVLREVKSLAHLSLSDAEEVQLRRNWCKLDCRRAGPDEQKDTARQSRVDARVQGKHVGNTLGYSWIEEESSPTQGNQRDRSPDYAESILPEPNRNSGGGKKVWAKKKTGGLG